MLSAGVVKGTNNTNSKYSLNISNKSSNLPNYFKVQEVGVISAWQLFHLLIAARKAEFVSFRDDSIGNNANQNLVTSD